MDLGRGRVVGQGQACTGRKVYRGNLTSLVPCVPADSKPFMETGRLNSHNVT